MISIKEIEKYYPENLRPFKRFIIREYLQYKILEIVFNSPYANKLCFLGGTCLRIVHEQNRFSEDLDFDNFNLTEKEFKEMSKILKHQLQREGYEVEIKNVISGAFQCHIKFPKILFNEGLTGHIEEKILIQLDTEPQHFEFKPEQHIINRFDVFTNIFTIPADILLSQKFYAIVNRPRNKGRDFFDVVFLLGKDILPNYDYLKLKLKVTNGKDLRKRIIRKCDKLNMKEMANDVAPFLFYSKDIKKIELFKEYLQKASL